MVPDLGQVWRDSLVRQPCLLAKPLEEFLLFRRQDSVAHHQGKKRDFSLNPTIRAGVASRFALER